MILSKEEFVDAIKEIKSISDYHEDLNEFFRKHNVDGYVYQPDGTVTSLKLLHKIFEKADKDDWIDYFVYELNFGKNYEDGCVKDKNGSHIAMSNAEELYDFLLKEVEVV